MVSNSYDAKAATIDVFPHYLMTPSSQPICSILAFFDDGRGMDTFPRTTTDNEGLTTPPQSSIDAFVQLGHSTNTGERSIGRFCYGSKQVFNKADAGFLLITRSERMPTDEVVLIDVDNMEQELILTGGVDWHVAARADAITAMRRRFARFQHEELGNTLRILSERITTMKHGTLQILFSRESPFHEHRLCDMNKLHRNWNIPVRKSRLFHEDIEFSTLYTIIRFFTRHGSVIHDQGKQFGVNLVNRIKMHHNDETLAHSARMRIFTKKYPDGFVVPYGYPRPEEQRHDTTTTPCFKVKRVVDMTGCWARLGPGLFTDDSGRPFSVMWDQNSLRVLLNDFEMFARRGSWDRADCDPLSRISGGFRVQAQGVRVCDLPGNVIRALPILPASQLTAWEKKALEAFLASGEKGGAVCTIEGNFGVETNRSALAQDEALGLKRNTMFLCGLANVLHAFMTTRNTHGDMMRLLLERHYKTQRDIDEKDIESEADKRHTQLDESSRIFLRKRENTPTWILPACMTYFIPMERSHEHQLQHLVSSFIPFALYAIDQPGSTTAAREWLALRAAIHFSAGVDVLTIFKEHERGEPDLLSAGYEVKEPTHNVEYKWKLETEFNHPFCNTEYIVAWCTDNLEPGVTRINDKQNYDSLVEADKDGNLWLRKIRGNTGDDLMSRKDASRRHTIRIISFRDLLRRTFEPFCDVELPPTRSNKRSRK